MYGRSITPALSAVTLRRRIHHLRRLPARLPDPAPAYHRGARIEARVARAREDHVRVTRWRGR